MLVKPQIYIENRCIVNNVVSNKVNKQLNIGVVTPCTQVRGHNASHCSPGERSQTFSERREIEADKLEMAFCVSKVSQRMCCEDVRTPWVEALRSATPPSFTQSFPLVICHGEDAVQPLSLLSVQTNEPPTSSGREKHPDFYANVGNAIRTLREDIPLLFMKDMDYSIYREDVVFRDPNLHFRGIKNYRLIFWSLRFHGRLFFKNVWVDILRIWQPEDHQIRIRWRVHGIPRVWWEAEGTVDGISTYKLDSDGMIYEHMVDNVQLRDPPITNPLLYGLNYVFAPRLRPSQVPYPGGSGSWFSPLESSGHDGWHQQS